MSVVSKSDESSNKDNSQTLMMGLIDGPCPISPIIDLFFFSHKNGIFSSPEPLGLQGELIVYPSSRRPSVVRPSVVVVVNNFKRLLLRNSWADQSQILCGASLGRGNDILFAASGSHDQDGRHTHIW